MKETVLNNDAFLVSETNAKGIITFANKQFCDVAEYSIEELQNQPHNLVRHADMPKAAFEDLWKTIQSDNVWQGFVKNKTKSGGFYWVHATIYPYKNEHGEKCFISCRRKPIQEKLEEAKKLYQTM